MKHPKDNEIQVFSFILGAFTTCLIFLLLAANFYWSTVKEWQDLIGAAIGVLGAYAIASWQIQHDKKKSNLHELDATRSAYIFFFNKILQTIRGVDVAALKLSEKFIPGFYEDNFNVDADVRKVFLEETEKFPTPYDIENSISGRLTPKHYMKFCSLNRTYELALSSTSSIKRYANEEEKILSFFEEVAEYLHRMLALKNEVEIKLSDLKVEKEEIVYINYVALITILNTKKPNWLQRRQEKRKAAK